MKKLICLAILFILFGCGMSHERMEEEYHLNKITSIEIATRGNCRFIYWTEGASGVVWVELIDSCGKHQVGDTVIIK